MNRKMWTILLLGLAAMMLLAQYALTQGCTPGYSNGNISMGDIQSQCVEQYPAPQTRTTVGIGEYVECWIDPSSWSGTAVYTDQYCNQTQTADGLGSITWTVSGQATVSPSVTYNFSSVYLVMDLADADNVVTVYAEATDALGVAPPVQKQKAFNAKVPTGAVVIKPTDNPPGGWQAGNANLGAATDFLFQVQPDKVNLSRVSFLVPFQGIKGLKWPDGTGWNIFPSTWGPWNTQNVGATQNLNTFSPYFGLDPVTLIAGINFNYTNSGNLNYQDGTDKDGNPLWKGVGNFSKTYKFQGATNQTADGVTMANNGNDATTWGGWQGPWK